MSATWVGQIPLSYPARQLIIDQLASCDQLVTQLASWSQTARELARELDSVMEFGFICSISTVVYKNLTYLIRSSAV